jgi:hypothetical protein
MPDRARVIRAERAPLLVLDRDLADAVTPERQATAENALVASTYRLAVGEMGLGELELASASDIGVLIVDGIIAREVLLGGTASTELLGAGDLIRPSAVDEPFGLLVSEVRWSVLSEARVALLDKRLGVELCRYPELYAALIDRVSQRSSRQAVTEAISKLTRVDRRLMALFWHIAERWGRVTPAGTVVRLRLSHRVLGQLVGARRPTVSAALAALAETGELVRTHDGSWLICAASDRMHSDYAERFIAPRRKLLAPVVGSTHHDGSVATEAELVLAQLA